MNIAICRLMGLALRPQLPLLDVKSVIIRIDRMQGLPASGQPETVALYGVVLVVFGCLKSWVSPDMKVTKTQWQCCDIHC